VQRIGGEMQCLVQFQAQAGGASAIEIGPTIHTRVNDPREQLVALGASGYQIRCDVMLSDEGGRFYQSLSRHIIAELDTETTLPESEQHAWITVKQLKRFIDAGDASIELRSLFVCLLAS
jgi:oxidase EvaA